MSTNEMSRETKLEHGTVFDACRFAWIVQTLPQTVHFSGGQMTKTVLLTLAFVFLAVLPTRGRGEFIPRNYEARRIAAPPILDGQLDDSIWQTAHVISDFFAYQSGGAPPASETSAKILWDDENIYLGFAMQDGDIRPSSLTAGETGRDAALFRGDVIEFFVRQDRQSPQYHEFEWSPNGVDVFDARFDNERFGSPGISWNTQIDWAVSVDGTIDDTSDTDRQWLVEAAIALNSFAPVDVDSVWSFTVARYDFFHPDHARPQLMMSTPGDPDLPQAGLSSGFHTYEFYDNLTFVHALGDFDQDGSVGIRDFDLLSEQIRSVTPHLSFDIDASGKLDFQDLKFLVHVPANTWFGDANLDGEFDSSDLVNVFRAAEYEDQIPNNSTWATGDWNADGEFTSGDLVIAFQDGGYDRGPRVATVPEPDMMVTRFALALCGVLAVRYIRL